MQISLSSFYENLQNLTQEEITEYVSFFGEKIFDHSEALKPEKAALISGSIPFSYPYVKKIIENKDLIELYWNNASFKKETIEDIEIANILAEHGLLKFSDLDSDVIERIFVQKMSNELADKYLALLTLENVEDVVDKVKTAQTYLAEKYFEYCFSNPDSRKYLFDKIVSGNNRAYRQVWIDLFPRDLLVEFVISKIEDSDDSLNLSILTVSEMTSLINRLKGPSKLRFLSKVISGDFDHDKFNQNDSDEFILAFIDAMPDDYLSDTLEELDSRQAQLIVNVLIENNRKLFFPKSLFSSRESDFIIKLINTNSSINEDMAIDLFEKMKIHGDLDRPFKGILSNENRPEIAEAIITHFKEHLESNKIWYSEFAKSPYSKILDLSKFSEEDTKHTTDESIASIKDSVEISGYSSFMLLSLMKNEHLIDEVFDYCLDKVISNQRESELNKVVPYLNEERQLKVFQRLDEGERFVQLELFDKIDSHHINNLLLSWLEGDYRKPLSYFDKIFKIIDIATIPVTQVRKILTNYSHESEINHDVVLKLFKRIENLPEDLMAVLVIGANGLLSKKLVSDDLFLKTFEELKTNSTYKSKVFDSDYYFSLLSNKQKGSFENVVKYQRDEEHVNKVIEVIENSVDDSLLQESIHPKMLEVFHDRNIVFKNQKITKFDDFNGKALEYALRYTNSLDNESVEELIQYSVNVESVWKYAEKEIKNGKELTDKVIISILNTKNPEFVKTVKSNIILNNSLSSEVLDRLLENEQLDAAFVLKIVKAFNSTLEINHKVKDIMKFSLENELVTMEQLVEVIENIDLMDNLYQISSRTNQTERKLIRYIRNQNKTQFLPEDYLTKLDLLDSEKTWEFYNAKIDDSYLSKMSSTEKTHFFKSLMNSYSEDKDVLHQDLLSFYKFDKTILFSLLNKASISNVKKVISEGIKEESLNKDLVLEWVTLNLKKLEEIEGYPTEFFISLYNAGIKNAFSANIERLDLEDGDLVDILNSSKDPYLFKKYEKNWKEITPYSKYNKEIIKELAKTVVKEDITKERISFEKGELLFSISGVELVKAKFVKKYNKWAFVSGERKDLYKNVREIYKELDSKFPDKILGTVNVMNGEFEPNEEISFPIKVRSEDSERLVYMRELGMEGNIPAVAKRNSTFGYSLDVNFERNSSIKEDEIKKEIQKKTFNIQNKLNELLKVNPSRTFGFELEMAVRYANRNEVAKFLKKKGFKTQALGSYGGSDGKQWDLKEDGSLSDSYIEIYDDETDEHTKDGDVFEVASPILKGREGISEAKRFLVSLFKQFDVESGQEVNAGLHVHHDIKDILDLEKDSEEIIKSYLPFQETLYSLIEDWRDESEFCVKIDPENIREGRGAYGNSGATGVLLTNHNTMEFRMKEGLTNVSDLLNWIIYTQNIVEAIFLKLANKVSKQKSKIEKLSEMTVYMLLDNQNATYSKSKIKSIRKLVGMQEFVYAQS